MPASGSSRRPTAPVRSRVGDDFSFRDGERLIRFADGACAEAPRLLAEEGFDGYALLTTARAAADAPALAEGAAVELHVPAGGVPEAADSMRARVEGRPVVALGGGRVVDTGKAIAGAEGLRVAAVPTTLAGSPFTPFHRMPASFDGYGMVRPALVVADPRLMASMPEQALAATAMNALAHAVEALYAPGANPVSDGAALRAATLFARGLTPGGLDRAALALAAVLGGYAVGVAGMAFHHAICQTIVRVAGTPHAQTNAVVLPHSVGFAAERAPEAVARLAAALGGSEDPELAAAAVALMSARSGLHALSELGVSEGQLDELADAAAAHPAMVNTPGGFGRDEARALLQSAFA